MKVLFENVAIRGMATAVPSECLDLFSLGSQFGEKEVKKLIASTGINKIRVAPPHVCISDICEAAARNLFQELAIEPASIDGVVLVSETPDYLVPPTSFILQEKLGLSKDIVAFDINHGCSGFIYGLYQASMLVSSGGCRRVLLCLGDVATRRVHPQDKAVRMMFGDSGSALLVERGAGSLRFHLMSDGMSHRALVIPAGGAKKPCDATTSLPEAYGKNNVRSEETLHMNGMDVMYFALREVPPMIEEMLADTGWSKEEVGTFALHQANRLILDQLVHKLKLPKEAVPFGVGEIGNSAPSSISTMLCVKHKQLEAEERLEKVVACGFGVGLSWAAVALDLSQTKILDVLEMPNA